MSPRLRHHIEHGYAEHPVDPTAYLRTVMLKLVLLKPGWWSRFFQERWRASKLGIASEINISLLGPGTGTRDHGTIWAHGPWALRAQGPREPWALRAHGPWALRAQGRALRARWALRAHLSPCRYAEDDFFAPYMRSKVCPTLVAP